MWIIYLLVFALIVGLILAKESNCKISNEISSLANPEKQKPIKKQSSKLKPITSAKLIQQEEVKQPRKPQPRVNYKPLPNKKLATISEKQKQHTSTPVKQKEVNTQITKQVQTKVQPKEVKTKVTKIIQPKKK